MNYLNKIISLSVEEAEMKQLITGYRKRRWAASKDKAVREFLIRGLNSDDVSFQKLALKHVSAYSQSFWTSRERMVKDKEFQAALYTLRDSKNLDVQALYFSLLGDLFLGNQRLMKLECFSSAMDSLKEGLSSENGCVKRAALLALEKISRHGMSNEDYIGSILPVSIASRIGVICTDSEFFKSVMDCFDSTDHDMRESACKILSNVLGYNRFSNCWSVKSILKAAIQQNDNFLPWIKGHITGSNEDSKLLMLQLVVKMNYITLHKEPFFGKPIGFSLVEDDEFMEVLFQGLDSSTSTTQELAFKFFKETCFESKSFRKKYYNEQFLSKILDGLNSDNEKVQSIAHNILRHWSFISLKSLRSLMNNEHFESLVMSSYYNDKPKILKQFQRSFGSSERKIVWGHSGPTVVLSEKSSLLD